MPGTLAKTKIVVVPINATNQNSTICIYIYTIYMYMYIYILKNGPGTGAASQSWRALRKETQPGLASNVKLLASVFQAMWSL